MSTMADQSPPEPHSSWQQLNSAGLSGSLSSSPIFVSAGGGLWPKPGRVCRDQLLFAFHGR